MVNHEQSAHSARLPVQLSALIYPVGVAFQLGLIHIFVLGTLSNFSRLFPERQINIRINSLQDRYVKRWVLSSYDRC